jgi:hypothetical protein
MAISKEIVQEATGVTLAHHVVISVTADKAGQTVTGQVASYVSADAKAAGKQPVGAPAFITVSGLPGAKENVFSFFENQIVAAQPADAASQPSAAYAFGGASRYTFAGGSVVADA